MVTGQERLDWFNEEKQIWVLCELILTESRKTAVDYSYPYETLQMVFANKAPGRIPLLFAYVYPFSPEVWYTLLALFLTMPFLWKAMFTCKASVISLFGEVFYTMLGRSATVTLTKFHEHILLGTWIAAVSFLSRSYTAVLLSFLTFPLQESVIRDIPRLSEAIAAGKYKCMTFKGTSVTESLKASPREYVRMIGRAIDKNEWFVTPTLEGVGKAIAEGNTAVIAMKPYFEDHYVGRASISTDHFSVSHFGIIFQKHFCCKKALNRKLSLILSAGLFEKCKRHYQFRAHLKLRTKNAEGLGNVNALSLENISGALLIYLLGTSVSLLAFSIETLLPKIKGSIIPVNYVQ
ncbi:Glutamate receptor ionotropic like protein [Argiope bruennichi]|uniref:Glutamate receptor ionotropic like protein n=1 Tax=Argiope bruennichi TaxID=94029 RepID=A0A8T0FBL3_ARGBR|nr:Glutamate receptor ionotropic like protein [Argiope bruennichi]